jgi:hypothetical protein
MRLRLRLSLRDDAEAEADSERRATVMHRPHAARSRANAVGSVSTTDKPIIDTTRHHPAPHARTNTRSIAPRPQ